MQRCLVSLAIIAALASCGPAPEVAENATESAAPAAGGILDEPRSEAGMQKFVAIATNPDWTKIEAEARALCEGQTHCGVFGWADPAQMASAMPMLDREVAALAFSYSLNRASSYEQFLRDCTRWPDPDASRCLAKAEPGT